MYTGIFILLKLCGVTRHGKGVTEATILRFYRLGIDIPRASYKDSLFNSVWHCNSWMAMGAHNVLVCAAYVQLSLFQMFRHSHVDAIFVFVMFMFKAQKQC